jgi:hypothetical protein
MLPKARVVARPGSQREVRVIAVESRHEVLQKTGVAEEGLVKLRGERHGCLPGERLVQSGVACQRDEAVDNAD